MKVFVALSSLLLAASIVTTSQALAQAAHTALPRYENEVVLHPGDVLKITVWDNPALSGDVVVGVNGTLEHPLYQNVHVAGIPLDAVDDSLRNYLTTFVAKPQFVAVPLFRVTVAGEVRTPGLYSLPRQTTIAQAVAQAGGVLATGRLDKVRIVRGGKEMEADLTRAGGPWTNAPVESGDQITVLKKSSFWTSIFLPIVGIAGAAASIINVVR